MLLLQPEVKWEYALTGNGLCYLNVMAMLRKLLTVIVLCFSFGVALSHSYHPKIYLFLGGGSPCNHIILLKNKNIAGAQVIYSWKRLEPRKNYYNFSPIFSDLACLSKINKKLFIQIQDRSFSKNNIPVPNYLLTDKYNGGVEKQLDNPGEGKPKAVGWVAKQWVLSVRQRFQRLIQHLGKTLDGKIEGINLPETAIDTNNQSGGFCQAYFDSTIENLSALKTAFPNTKVVQYVNFFPCEWNNNKGYMKKLFDYAVKHNIGLGNPDTVPYRKSQMKNSYPFFHTYHAKLIFTAIAVQEPDYTYTNPETGKKFTVSELYFFARNYLGANIIFWSIKEPELTDELLPFLKYLNENRKFYK